MKYTLRLVALFVATWVVTSCTNPTQQKEAELSIDYEKYTLENGLEVVLHHDASDPIVSVAILYHVGSNREKPGRTGFAHLFEHMLFQESENVPQDQFFKKIQDAGGTLNGGTWQDGTVYYEVVPNNALEMVLWMESDRMGYMINTVTQSAFMNQQEVVINEKRQRVDNNPYGHTNYVIDKNIYPEDHPYNWQVIGEMEDLLNATVEDVKEFHHNFYGPNNATLVIAGDFKDEETKAWVEKYFGEIKRGPEVEPLPVQRVTLNETKRLYHEDNFATASQLNMVWPTVEQFSRDAYALDFLAELLSEGKKAPMYKVMVKDKLLTSDVTAYGNHAEIAGTFQIRVTANEGVLLDSVEAGVFESFQRFEEEGISDTDIQRIKASLETDFYNAISSLLGKSFQLSIYNVFAGEPNFITQDIDNIKAVTKEDVMRVYNTYIKDKPFVLTSFVPKGQLALAASNSTMATVVEEEIKPDEAGEAVVEDEEVVKTPSNFDRSVEPAKGPDPTLNIPVQWSTKLDNGLSVYGIEQNELPLVQMSLVIKGGHYLDKIDNNGVANLMTDIMQEGTANKTPEELEEAIELLGATIRMYTSDEAITITANCLARNFDATLKLMEEMLLEPRWDEEELELIKTRTVNSIKRSSARPNVVAGQVYKKLLYGTDHIYGHPISGKAEEVEAITMEDLKAFYEANYSPSVSSFHVVGAVSQENALKSLDRLNKKWANKPVEVPQYALPEQGQTADLYFVDFENAKQSVINIGYLSMARTDADYYPATVMNYKLGGSFSGNVNLILREEKGYTYGARTYFSGSTIPGPFTASSSVRTNSTYESVKIFKEEMETYSDKVSEEDLAFTKNALIKSNARNFETLGSLLGMLQNRSMYGFEADYIKKQEDVIRQMSLEELKALATKYVDPARMKYVVAGDAATQYEALKNAGFDSVQLVDKEGNEVPYTKVED